MRPFSALQSVGLPVPVSFKPTYPVQRMRRTERGLELPPLKRETRVKDGASAAKKRFRALVEFIKGWLRPRPAAQLKSVREPCYTHALVGAVVAVLIALWAMGLG